MSSTLVALLQPGWFNKHMAGFSSFKKWLVRLSAALLGLLLLLAGAGIWFEDDVKALFISEVNKQLAVPITLSEDQLHFSLFRHFPDASLAIDSLAIPESLEGSDLNFLEVASLDLRFSPIDLVRKKYTIRSISIRGGKLNLTRNSAGKVNYQFWKPSEDTASRPIDLVLDELLLEDIQFEYDDRIARQQTSMQIQQALASGSFQPGQYALKLTGTVIPDELQFSGKTLAAGNTVKLTTSLKSVESETIQVENCQLEIDRNEVQLAGLITTGAKPGGRS